MSFGDTLGDIYLIRLDKEIIGIQDDNYSGFIKPDDFMVTYDHGNIAIRYTVPYSTSVKLEAFDIHGRLVEVIEDRFMHKGSYRVKWESKRFGVGIYFLRLSASSFANASANRDGSEVSRKVMVIR